MTLRALGIIIIVMALLGMGLNWRDWMDPSLETPFREGDYRQMQMILALFGAGGLGLVIYDWWRKR